MFTSETESMKYYLISIIMLADAQRIGRRGDNLCAEHLQALEDCFVYQREMGTALPTAINYFFTGRLRDELQSAIVRQA